MKAADLQLDVSAEGARALQRVIRAMHDGHCPKCGYLAASWRFVWRAWIIGPKQGHKCPSCRFYTTTAEETAALAAFAPHFLKSAFVFLEWRNGRPLPTETR